MTSKSMNWYKQAGIREQVYRLLNKWFGENIGGQQYKSTVGPGIDPRQLAPAEHIMEGVPHKYDEMLNQFYEAKRLADEAIKTNDQQKLQKAYNIAIDLANKHPMTGLPSREYHRAVQRPNTLKVMIDIDNLKWMNDNRLTHSGADAAIEKVSEIIYNIFGQLPGATMFHPYGDEMRIIISMDGMNDQQKVDLINRTYEVASQAMNELPKYLILHPEDQLKGARPTATASIGFDKTIADSHLSEEKQKRKDVRIGYKPKFVVIAPDAQAFLDSQKRSMPPKA